MQDKKRIDKGCNRVRTFVCLVPLLALTSCAATHSEPRHAKTQVSISTTAAQPNSAAGVVLPMHQNTADTASPVQEGDTKMAQCNRELMALKSVNRAEYAHYHTEMNSLVASGRVYMGVRGTVSQDINDIVEPGYQYGTAKLCWRIRNSLAQSLIRQADAGTGRTQ